MNRRQFLLTVMYALMTALTVLRVYVQVELGHMVVEYAAVLEETEQLKRENKRLQTVILEKSAYIHIASEAARIGFIPGTTYQLK